MKHYGFFNPFMNGVYVMFAFIDLANGKYATGTAFLFFAVVMIWLTHRLGIDVVLKPRPE